MSLETTSTLIKTIARVDLRVTDVDRALAFYRDVVGLEVADRGPETAALSSPSGPSFITLTSTGVDAPASRSSSGLYHTAIRFPDRKALAGALARLAEAGLRIGASDHAVSEALYIDDPDGNGVELYRDRPRAEWPPPQKGQRLPAMMAPLDLQGLLDEASSEARESRAEEGTDVGHVHLQVGDLDRTIAFYVDVLGLDLMTRLGDQAGFFSSRGYHHHLGANTWHSRGRGPAPRNRAGLDRIVFTADEPDIEALDARLAERGCSPQRTNGTVEVSDPDGITLRFATEGAHHSD